MSGSALKLIAVVTMIMDHTGDIFFPDQIWIRCIGRLSFPIFCFLLVEGFLYTRNLQRYMMRLLVFGLISEIPFDLAFYGEIFAWNHQNVMWTLLLGLIAISFMSMVEYDNIYVRSLIRMLIAVPFGITAQLLHTDYRWIGVAMMTAMYIFHDMELLRDAAAAFLMMPVFTNHIEYYGILSFIPIHFYNGERGIINRRSGWLLYVVYPAHLAIMVLIRDHICT
ncbi:MAG: conjugal transfer protein TraX [Lachnospiraceae bacterium]|nr:conjugal transfer protein TraX [Lachnospiraceae bacterium]